MPTTIISRRHFLALLGGMGMSGCLRGPMLFNPCLPARLPESLIDHNELVRQAFDGLHGLIISGTATCTCWAPATAAAAPGSTRN